MADETEVSERTQLRRYLAVLDSVSAAIFKENDMITFPNIPTNHGNIDLIFYTPYLDGFEAKAPLDLWIEARGTGDDLDETINRLTQVVQTIIPIFCIATNCVIQHPAFHLAYDETPDVAEREFIQERVAISEVKPTKGTLIDPPSVIAVYEAMFQHPGRDRILRAIAQYHAALLNWEPGMETMALCHLYMGVEALTKTCLRHELDRLEVTEAGLASQWGYRERPCNTLSRFLESETRFRLIFRSDKTCYKTAKEASDGFEHGFLDFAEVHSKAAEVRDRTAFYLRSAILGVLEPSPTINSMKSAAEESKVRSVWQTRRYLRAILTGNGDALAADGFRYPVFDWKSKLTNVREGSKEDPDIALTYEDSISARFGPSVKCLRVSPEFFGHASSRP